MKATEQISGSWFVDGFQQVRVTDAGLGNWGQTGGQIHSRERNILGVGKSLTGGQVGKDHMLKPAEGACLSKMSRESRKDFKQESNGLECWKNYPDSFRKRDFRSKVISLSDSAGGSVVTAGVL